jgi:Uma2 family endonuclease
MSSEIARRLFTIDDCYKMAEVGILSPVERVELIRGEILVMRPTGPRHGTAVDRTNRALVRLVGDTAIVRTQGTVVLDRFAAPQPDLVLLRPKEDEYVDRNPDAADILLLIEIADSSLDYDTTVKLGLYAILGIPEYWVADLHNHRVLIYTDPDRDAYRTKTEVRRGETIEPQLLTHCRILADLLLP